MKRPLYLDGLRVKSVTLDDTTLIISAHALAKQRFPLNRISRIVNKGDIQWSTQALTTCMQRHIPISFMLNSLALAGLCIGHGKKPSTHLEDQLLNLEASHDIHHILQNWKRHRRRELILALANTQSPPPQDLRAKRMRKWLERKIAQQHKL